MLKLELLELLPSNGVVAQYIFYSNPIWTLGNDSLLLTHSSGEDIAITELTGVVLNVKMLILIIRLMKMMQMKYHFKQQETLL